MSSCIDMTAGQCRDLWKSCKRVLFSQAVYSPRNKSKLIYNILFYIYTHKLYWSDKSLQYSFSIGLRVETQGDVSNNSRCNTLASVGQGLSMTRQAPRKSLKKCWTTQCASLKRTNKNKNKNNCCVWLQVCQIRERLLWQQHVASSGTKLVPLKISGLTLAQGELV